MHIMPLPRRRNEFKANMLNRALFKLKKLRVVNSPDIWIKKEGSFEAIALPEARSTLWNVSKARGRRYIDEEPTEGLRAFCQSRVFCQG
jgi:hypothetical protein